MSLEQHNLTAPPTDTFGQVLVQFSARGWTVQRSTHGRQEVAVVVGAAGILVLGGARAETRTLHTRAGEVCAALPARLRRHVLVIEPDALADVDDLPAALSCDDLDEATALLADLPTSTGLTVAKVLEWTRNAGPEPARQDRPESRLTRPAAWLTRHGALFVIIAVCTAMLVVVGLGRGTATDRTVTTAGTSQTTWATPTPDQVQMDQIQMMQP